MINGFSFWGEFDAETKRIEGHGEYGKRFRMTGACYRRGRRPFALNFFGNSFGGEWLWLSFRA